MVVVWTPAVGWKQTNCEDIQLNCQTSGLKGKASVLVFLYQCPKSESKCSVCQMPSVTVQYQDNIY